jgi:hypothetical protein
MNAASFRCKENPRNVILSEGGTPESKDPGAGRCMTSVTSFTAIFRKNSILNCRPTHFQGPSTRAFALAQDDKLHFCPIRSTLPNPVHINCKKSFSLSTAGLRSLLYLIAFC